MFFRSEPEPAICRPLSAALRERLTNFRVTDVVVASGLCDATAAAILAESGKISVNGRVASRLTRVDVMAESVEVTGRPVEELATFTAVVDKPVNMYVTREAGISGLAKRTAKDAFAARRPDLFVRCAAPLDFRSSGLVVFSNDRKFQDISDHISEWHISIKPNFRPPCLSELRLQFHSAEFLHERLVKISAHALTAETLAQFFPGAFRFRRVRLGDFRVEDPLVLSLTSEP